MATMGSTAGPAPMPGWGQGSQAALALQKALLESYEQASRAWLARVQSEVNLWSELANKLSSTHSLPEGLEAYSKCVSQRMQMAADDGRRIVEQSQQITQKIAQSLGKGWSAAGT